jgi:transcriptional antiterminator RfaH
MADAATSRWYVVHTHPSAEQRAATHIVRQGFAVYLPQYLKKRRHARRVDTVAAPLFPRYLFVAIDLSNQRWRAINSTVGVSRLISSGDELKAVLPGVVEAIRAREDGSGFLDMAAPRFRPGTPVRVTRGAFEACCGIFEAASDHDRIAILLDMLGRKVRVMLDDDAVEAL